MLKTNKIERKFLIFGSEILPNKHKNPNLSKIHTQKSCIEKVWEIYNINYNSILKCAEDYYKFKSFKSITQPNSIEASLGEFCLQLSDSYRIKWYETMQNYEELSNGNFNQF